MYEDVLNILVGGKFKLDSNIGTGHNAEIFNGFHIKTGQQVACKVAEYESEKRQLRNEHKVYTLLLDHEPVGFAKLQWFGTEEKYDILVMDCLGESLKGLFAKCSKHFTLKTILMIADQLISRFETLHSLCYIHGSVKPVNIVVGVKTTSSIIYLIDFGRSREYYNKNNGLHSHYYEGISRYKGMFFSVNASQGKCPTSRRDDMKSLGYMFMYFLRGSLPWEMTTYAYTPEGELEIKMNSKIDDLCEGYPVEFNEYLRYVTSLEFEEQPDYTYLRGLFKDLFIRSGYEDDGVFDWDLLKLEKLDKELQQQMMKPSAEDNSNIPPGPPVATGTTDTAPANTSSCSMAPIDDSAPRSDTTTTLSCYHEAADLTIV